MLYNSRYELAKCEVEIGRFQLVEADLRQNENNEQQHLQSIAKDRRINETFIRDRSTKQRQNQKMFETISIALYFICII